MNVRYILACLAVWVFFLIFDNLIHGCLLSPFYEERPEIWRPQAAMCGLFPWMLAAQGIIAFLFGLIFTKGYERLGIAEGARYGWLIGLLFAAGAIIWYVVLPISGSLAVSWAVTDLAKFTLAGVLLAAIYRPRKS